MKTILSISVFLLLLCGCEGNRLGRGKVVDSVTKIPLDSVQYGYAGSDLDLYTDSIGAYSIDGPFGSCVVECPDFKVTFAKTGYQSKTVKNPDGKILLVKQ